MLSSGYIPDSIKACRTTLIPKKGEVENINNWRPITVTSLLIRVLNRILAKRLSTFTINCAQKGIRNIDGCLANAMLLHSLIKECRAKARPYNILTLDLKKAFDMVSIHSIPRALARVGVHPKTVNIITAAYTDCITRVTCNKAVTNPIKMSRGVKQGDPLSPALFNLVTDELLCRVDHSNGIEIGNTRAAVAAYTDDLLIMGPSIDKTQLTLNGLVDFLSERGLPLNIGKCTALYGACPTQEKVLLR